MAEPAPSAAGRDGDRMAVAILGTGALATLFGARLARAGHPVVLVGTWPEALSAIARDGLRVTDEAGTWSAPARAIAAGEAEGEAAAPLVLVLVKSGQTARVAPLAARLAAPGGLVVTLQNGLGNAEILAAACGAERVVRGVVTAGGNLAAPGHVRAAGPGQVILGGAPGAAARLADVAAALARAGFDVAVRDDIEAVAWLKLAVNCAINPLAALHGLPNGGLLADPALCAQLVDAAREVGDVAAARGVALGSDPAAFALEVARRTAANRSSMLQDIERGVPTEIEAINGAVVREGERLGVSTPVNARLLAAVRALERSAMSPVAPDLARSA